MTDKELKRLNRSELLQILLEQSIEIEKLQQQLAAAQQALAQREVKIAEAGTLAEAALRLNTIFADADAAAALYLDNIRRLEAEYKEKCAALAAKEQQDAVEEEKQKVAEENTENTEKSEGKKKSSKKSLDKKRSKSRRKK